MIFGGLMRVEFETGSCECRGHGCTCEKEPGPAAFKVKRADGREMKVCTLCTWSDDCEQELLVTKMTHTAPFLMHDPIGAQRLSAALRWEPPAGSVN